MSWPYMAYHATLELEKRLTPESQVFEWGSGESTIWLAERCGYVTSVEHNRDFFKQMLHKIPENVNLKYRPLTSDYYEAIEIHRQYDIIIIDGRMRMRCVRAAIPCLKMGGTLVLDDTFRHEYRAAMVMLQDWPSETWEENLGCPSIEKQTTLFVKTEEREPKYYDEIMKIAGIPA